MKIDLFHQSDIETTFQLGFTILISSFGCAISFPHFLQFSVLENHASKNCCWSN